MIICLVIFSSKHSEQPGGLPEVLLTWGISLHHYLSRMSQKEAVVLQLSTLRRTLYITQPVSVKKAWVFFFYQLIIGSTQETIYTDWERKGKIIEKGVMNIGVILQVTYLCPHGFHRPTHIYISFPFDNGILLCTPNCMTWWIWLYPNSWWTAQVTWWLGVLWLSVQCLLSPHSRLWSISQNGIHYL